MPNSRLRSEWAFDAGFHRLDLHHARLAEPAVVALTHDRDHDVLHPDARIGGDRMDEAITAYERGALLKRHCEQKLAEAESMLGYQSGNACRMRFLQEALDDPSAKAFEASTASTSQTGCLRK